MENKLTPELREKAKQAKTPEELAALAKENGIELTPEEANTYFAQLNPKTGELADDELESVAGGRKCGTIYDHGKPVITALNTCEYFTRPGEWEARPNDGYCKDCRYGFVPDGGCFLCNCPARYNN